MKLRLLAIPVLLASCTLLRADTVPVLPDPDIQIDVGADSLPLGSFTAVNGGGIFDFFNSTGRIVTSLQLTTRVDPSVFHCSVLAFFKSCSIEQDATGFVTVLFHGVNPEEDPGDPLDNNDPREREGLFPKQHFTINLNKGFAHPPVPEGGWLLDGRNATFTMTANVPEPGSLFLMGGAGLLLAWRRKRRAHS